MLRSLNSQVSEEFKKILKDTTLLRNVTIFTLNFIHNTHLYLILSQSSYFMAYIYSITNKINSKHYIGKTSKDNPYDRWKEHIYHSKHKENTVSYSSVDSMPIIRAMRKYGVENFKFRVLEECKDDIVNERESHYITEYDTYYKGYNATFGGEGVKKDPKQWSNHPKSRAVSCYTLEGNYICDYDTAGVAILETLGHTPDRSERSCIRVCCNNKVFQSHGYRWTWKGEQLKEWKDKQVRIRCRIYGYHIDSGEYKEWDSQADCAEEIEGNRYANANVKLSLDSPRTAKIHCKRWWLFRFDGTRKVSRNHIKVTDKNRGFEYYSALGKKSAEERKKKVKAVEKGLGTKVLYFDSLSEASYFIKGEGNRRAVANIHKNIHSPKWCHAYGYKWYYV